MLTAQLLASAGVQADKPDQPTALQLITVPVVEECATEVWDVESHARDLCSGIDLVNRQTTLASATQRQQQECEAFKLKVAESHIRVARMGVPPAGRLHPAAVQRGGGDLHCHAPMVLQ